MKILRVFPRRTAYTPRDPFAFVGDPPLLRPEADAVMVSSSFTWDKAEAGRLAAAWEEHYPGIVQLGGPAFGSPADGFMPGMYVKLGVVFTSRGCHYACPWCLVPSREGPLRLIEDFAEGNIIQDNAFLSTPAGHRERVYQMLQRQPRAAVFAGGLDPGLVTDAVAEEFRTIRITQVFLACDTVREEGQLAEALKRLGFLGRHKLRCYVLCAYGGETLSEAEARLERIWEMGAMPFCQLYQPPDRYIAYTAEWRALQRKWTRPAAMAAAARDRGSSA